MSPTGSTERGASARGRAPRLIAAADPVQYTQAVQNVMPLDIDVYERDPASGVATYLGSLPSKGAQSFTTTRPTLRIIMAQSGSVITDHVFPGPPAGIVLPKLIVEPAILIGPNHIPPPPPPSAALMIPPDTVPFLVGIGSYGTTPVITFLREQYWRKASGSFSLPPRSSIQKILRQSSGRTATSSTTEEVTKELSLSAKAGWGPFSASASASLSTTSQRTDTLTIREESTSTITQTFTNETDDSIITCLWQLMERIRVYKDQKGVAAIDSGLLPLIPLSYTLPSG